MVNNAPKTIEIEIGRFTFALTAMFILGAVAETLLLKIAGVF